MAESGSLTVYPGAYDQSDYSFSTITNRSSPVGNGSGNTTYAIIKGDRNATGHIRWPFDLAGIPAGAKIDSVVCNAKVDISAINSIYTKLTLQLATGTTLKGSSVTFAGTNPSVLTLDQTGAWTRDELISCNLLLEFYTSASAADQRNIYFYGADLTVTYTYQSEKFMLKLGGAWHDIARVFKKVNDIWVEQTDLANVIEDGVRYQNGGEIVKPITVDITSSGHYSYAYAEINGVKYYSNGGSTEVNAGDVITFGVYNGGKLKIDGETILTAASGATSTYDWTVPSGITSISIAPLYYTVISPTYYGYVTVTTTGGGGESTPTLISFTMTGGLSWQAEEGMTWGEWIDSEYATANSGVTFEPTNNSIEVYRDGRWWGTLTDQSENFIKTADKIVGGYKYWIV